MAELYQFIDGSTYYTYTPGIDPITFEGREYLPIVIQRTDLRKSGNLNKSSVSINFDLKNSFALYILNRVAETSIKFSVYKDGTLYWKGKVRSAKSDGISIQINCDSIAASLKQGGIKDTMSLHCRHKLYSSRCGILQYNNEFIYPGMTISAVNFTVLSLTAPNNFFSNGIAVINNETRGILKQTGTLIKLAFPFSSIMTGTLKLYPGCGLNEVDCRTKFNVNNLVNYGGFSRIPLKNPFGSEGLL